MNSNIFQDFRLLLLKGPVVLSRDHHDVSGTDSPFRETANISDGSAFCAGNLILFPLFKTYKTNNL